MSFYWKKLIFRHININDFKSYSPQKKKIDNRKFNIFALNSIYYSHLSIVVCYLGKKNLRGKKRRNKNKPVPHTYTSTLRSIYFRFSWSHQQLFVRIYFVCNICRLLQCLYRILEKKKEGYLSDFKLFSVWN